MLKSWQSESIGESMKHLQLIKRALFSAMLFCIPLGAPPVMAQEQELQETLRRMESLCSSSNKKSWKRNAGS